MTQASTPQSTGGWMCNRCRVPLEVQKVRLQYARVIFAHHLPVCPKCGMVFISEELAVGQMAEAEQILEDK